MAKKRRFNAGKAWRGFIKLVAIAMFLFFIFFASNGYTVGDLMTDAGQILENIDRR